jgi:CMP-N,N'-diacetyllegionaminic acid synthase
MDSPGAVNGTRYENQPGVTGCTWLFGLNRQVGAQSEREGRVTGVLAVVPARGGSKGLVGKNLRPLAGVPLVVHAIRQATAAKTVDRVIVSTDSPEIAEVASAAGAEVPFLRPAEYAIDTATDLDVFDHLLRFLSETEGRLPELLVQVRATSPVRRPHVIDLAVRKMLARPDATSLRSVSPVPFPPYKMWRIDGQSRLKPVASVPGIKDWYDQPRQALPQAYAQDGLVDVIRPRTIIEERSMAGSFILGLLHPERAVDIDTLADLRLAEDVLASLASSCPEHRQVGIIQGRLTIPWNGALQCFPSGRWAEEFTLAQGLGFNAIEVIASIDDADNPLLDDAGAARLAEASARTGIAVRAACLDYVMTNDLRSPASVEWLHALAQRLATVGATTAVLPLFGASEITEAGASHEMVPHLRRLADAMGRSGLRLCLESAMPGAELYEYLGLLDHGNIGVCYDLGNTTAFGHDTVSDLELLAPFVWHVHVKDKDASGRNVPLGSGRARLAELFRVMAENGCDCMLSLETPRGDDPRLTAKNHLEIVRRLEAEAQ